MYKNLSAPLVVQIEVTERCPNSCIHCYNYWRHQGRQDAQCAQLSLEQVNRIMDELEKAKVFLVVITGGEPMLNKKAMYAILDRVEQSDFMFATINSSLIGMTDEDAKQLRQYQRLTGVLTSLMGPNSEVHDDIAKHPGAYATTIAGIRKLVSQMVPTSVNMVLSKLNQEYIMETAALSKTLGVKMFNVTRATCPSNCDDFTDYALGLEELRKYFRTLKVVGSTHGLPVGVLTVYPLCAIREAGEYGFASGRTCSAGVTVAVISSVGDMRACTHLEKPYGNLFLEPLTIIWQRMVEWRDGSLIPNTCRACKALALCGGGCRAEAEVASHSLSAVDPLMSLPDVDYAIKSFQESRHPIDSVLLPEELVCNPDLRWRSEDFGVVCYIRTKCPGILNAEVARIILQIDSTSSFNVVDLSEKLSTPTVEKLFQKGILIPRTKEVSTIAEYPC